jgi:hypothetical protein
MSISEAYKKMMMEAREGSAYPPEEMEDKMSPSDKKWAAVNGGIDPDPDTDDPTYDGEAAADQNQKELEQSTAKAPGRPGDKDVGDKKPVNQSKAMEATNLGDFFSALYEEADIQELSKNTLGKYADKAIDRAEMAARMYKNTGKGSDTDANKQMSDYADKRRRGAKLATQKLSGRARINAKESMFDDEGFDFVNEKNMDPVDKSELDNKYKNRDDKDIDNDGDTDASDEYLHKRRQAISKNMKESAPKMKHKVDPVKKSREADKEREKDMPRYTKSGDKDSRYKVNEEESQLDELSKKTLGSYVRKAGEDMYRRGTDSQYHSNKANKAEGPFKKETQKKHSEKAATDMRKAGNRADGINRAVSRLTKEDSQSEAYMGAAMSIMAKRKAAEKKRQEAQKNEGPKQ